MILCYLLVNIWIIGFGIVNERNHSIKMQERLIGLVYENNSEICNRVLKEMFEGNESNQVHVGKQALVDLGYTDRGMYFLNEQTNPNYRIYIFIFLQILLSLVFFLIIGRMVKWKKQEEIYIYENEKLKEELSVKECYMKEQEKKIQMFIENIAHQMKTPLCCVTTSLDILLHSDKKEFTERVEGCFENLSKIESLIKRLTDIGRLEAGKIVMKKEKFQLPELLEDCIITLDAPVEKFELKINEKQKETKNFYGDYEWLKEALLNILKNCVEYDESEEKIEIDFTETTEGSRIVIRDHGRGFEEQDLPYVFQRFYNASRTTKSHVGIGLNLAKLVIEKHFGTIKAENHKSGGACFIIFLPTYPLKNEKI